MEKKVWVIMESWSEEYYDAICMGYVNCVYEDYNEAVKAQENLVKFNKKNFPNDFYTNWIVEKELHYEK